MSRHVLEESIRAADGRRTPSLGSGVSMSQPTPDTSAPGRTDDEKRHQPVDSGAPIPHSTIPWTDIRAVADVTITAGGRRVAPAPSMWTADTPGEQLIDVRFQQPTNVRRIRIVSSETERSRTQEMTIWASLLRGERHREVLRQQFNFSPRGATLQVEDYSLELNDVSSIQVRIVPSIDGSPAIACVTELQIETSAQSDAAR